jgi:hypothetical protein
MVVSALACSMVPQQEFVGPRVKSISPVEVRSVAGSSINAAHSFAREMARRPVGALDCTLHMPALTGLM